MEASKSGRIRRLLSSSLQEAWIFLDTKVILAYLKGEEQWSTVLEGLVCLSYCLQTSALNDTITNWLYRCLVQWHFFELMVGWFFFHLPFPLNSMIESMYRLQSPPKLVPLSSLPHCIIRVLPLVKSMAINLPPLPSDWKSLNIIPHFLTSSATTYLLIETFYKFQLFRVFL